MKNLTRVFKLSSISAFTSLLFSCGAGFDYDPNTATLTIVPGEVISFGDLKPDITASDLYVEALAFEAENEGKKAFKVYKTIAKDFPYSTKAPESVFRIAQYHEKDGKFKKAFDMYQVLITTYMGTPLYQAAIERQTAIAHGTIAGDYKDKLLFLKIRVPTSVSDEMLSQLLENAPYAKTAPESAYLRAYLWETNKREEKAMVLYREVTRKYGESVYAGEALFRIGNILHKQSQRGNTNLDNSVRAIDAFDELITLYPNHPKKEEAKALRAEISGYDIRRSLEIAQFHEEKEEFVSALFYYKEILNGTKAGTAYHKIAANKIKELSSN